MQLIGAYIHWAAMIIEYNALVAFSVGSIGIHKRGRP